MTENYTPNPGDQVRVRRYQVPCPELPGYAERKLLEEHVGTAATVQPKADGVLLTLEGLEDAIFTGCQFTGQDPFQGCSWTLQTEVVRLADVAAHDQAEHDARVAAGEAEVARALALWERARDAEAAALRRLIAARDRLAVIKRARPAPAAIPDLDALSETRKTDRAVMAGHVEGLARSHGLRAEVAAGGRGPLGDGSRAVHVDVEGPHGLKVTVVFDGNSPQSAPDTYVLSWHGVEDGWRLFPAVFGGSVNPYHGHKATDVAHGFRDLTELLTRRFTAIADGSAFVPACCRYHELGGRADFPCRLPDPAPAD